MITYLLAKLHMESKSKEMMAIMVCVYMTTFINMGFIVMLSMASLADFEVVNDPNQWFFNLFHRDGFTDFSSKWYASVGFLLMNSMFFDVIKTVCVSVVTICITWLKRFLDRGCSSDRYKTKKTSIQAYVNLYSGPAYKIDGRFSLVLMFLSMAFVYGTSMPLFFPIGVFGYFALWVNERLQLCYFYR